MATVTRCEAHKLANELLFMQRWLVSNKLNMLQSEPQAILLWTG